MTSWTLDIACFSSTASVLVHYRSIFRSLDSRTPHLRVAWAFPRWKVFLQGGRFSLLGGVFFPMNCCDFSLKVKSHFRWHSVALKNNANVSGSTTVRRWNPKQPRDSPGGHCGWSIWTFGHGRPGRGSSNSGPSANDTAPSATSRQRGQWPWSSLPLSFPCFDVTDVPISSTRISQWVNQHCKTSHQALFRLTGASGAFWNACCHTGSPEFLHSSPYS